MTDSKWQIHEPVFEADSMVPDYRVWPWNGHRRFGYDLVRFLRPASVVELGTYWGTSFFCFCQAVKDGGLDTRLAAVDTWQGDEHTGSYSSEIFETVQKVKNTFFSEQQIELHRCYFHEALENFADESIELLHIDGFHTYEAVREDFTGWLPKLAEDGVVLFHDIADDTGYGSTEYWKEVRASYPGFDFQHSWGLGVLFPKGDRRLRLLQENNLQDKKRYYTAQSELDLLTIQYQAELERSQEHEKVIAHQQELVSLLERQLQEAALQPKSRYGQLLAKIRRILS